MGSVLFRAYCAYDREEVPVGQTDAGPARDYYKPPLQRL